MKPYCVFLLFILSGNFSVFAQESPEMTLKYIQKSIDTHDIELFKKYVAVNTIIREGVHLFFHNLSSGDGYKISPSLQQLLFFTQSPESLDIVQDMLVKEIQDFVDYGICSGFFSGDIIQVQPKGFLAILIMKASTGRKEVLFSRDKLLLAQEQSKDEIILPIIIKDHGNNRCYTVVVTMRQHGSIWKIDAVNNMNTLIKQMEYERTE